MGRKGDRSAIFEYHPTLSNLKPEEMNYYRNNDVSKVFNV